MYDRLTGVVRFDEAFDFDTVREPHVGNYVTIFPDGVVKEGNSLNIWHHKWLWVRDDYGGFDVDESKRWSEKWLSKVPEIAKGSDVTWNAQLKKYGVDDI